MQLSKTVQLDENRAAVVREITTEHMFNILAEHCQITEALLLDVVRANRAEVIAVLGDRVELPPGESFTGPTSIGLSDLLKIDEAFREVNASVFQLAARMDALAAGQNSGSNSSVPPAQP